MAAKAEAAERKSAPPGKHAERGQRGHGEGAQNRQMRAGKRRIANPAQQRQQQRRWI